MIGINNNKQRKPTPSPPKWVFLSLDYCWCCKNMNNCHNCKIMKEYKVIAQKKRKRKEKIELRKYMRKET